MDPEDTPAPRLLTSADQAELEAFLLPRMESSLFLLSNSRAVGMDDHGGYRQGTYLGLPGHGPLAGVVCLCWNGNLLLQAPGPELEPLVEAAVGPGRRELGGLVGPAAQVARALALLRPPAERVQMDETEGLYRLDLAELRSPADLATGRVEARRTREDDLELLAAWHLAYALEALGAKDGPEVRDKARRDAARGVAEGIGWVATVDGQPVAMSSFNATLADAVQVGGVYTPPESRGRGYARVAVAASLAASRDAGARLGVLFTGEANIPAIRAYAALGFRLVGDYRIVLLRPAEPSGSRCQGPVPGVDGRDPQEE